MRLGVVCGRQERGVVDLFVLFSCLFIYLKCRCIHSQSYVGERKIDSQSGRGRPSCIGCDASQKLYTKSVNHLFYS